LADDSRFPDELNGRTQQRGSEPLSRVIKKAAHDKLRNPGWETR
jgi:hypothetical protein